MWYRSSQKSDNELYLEMELEREREWRREEKARREQEREQRMAAIRKQAEWDARRAKTWREALRKQASLAGGEAIYERFHWVEYAGWGTCDSYFIETRAACLRGERLLATEEARVRPQIRELERQIAELRLQARQRAGERLAQEKQWNSAGWAGVAQILQDPDADMDNWLNW